MRREIKLILLVFILVVGPAIAVSFLSARVLVNWRIVLQKRMEQDAGRVLDQATAAWERERSALVGTSDWPVFQNAQAISRAANLAIRHPWIERILVFQRSKGLIYPPVDNLDSFFVPEDPYQSTLWNDFNAVPGQVIQDCERLLSRPDADPARRAVTRLRLAEAYLSAGATNQAVECLQKAVNYPSPKSSPPRGEERWESHPLPSGERVGVRVSPPFSGEAVIRDPEEGFSGELIALKRLADLLAIEGDKNEVIRVKNDFRRRVLASYDQLVPIQRELAIQWAEKVEGIGHRSEAENQLEAEWRERMAARRLSETDRAKLAEDIERWLPALREGDWIRGWVRGREVLAVKLGVSRQGSEVGKPQSEVQESDASGLFSDGKGEGGGVVIMAVEFDRVRLVQYLNTFFEGVTSNSGIRIRCAEAGRGGLRPISSSPGDELALLATRRLSSPLDSIMLSAYPVDGRAFTANARLQSRLYRWGGGLLLISIVMGGWLVWREVSSEIRQARERSDFAATVSHDLRTPLSSMRMLAESLYLGHIADQAKRQKFLGAIIKESDRLSRLTDRALYFIRYGQGALRYQFMEGDLGSLVKDAVETFAVGVGAEVSCQGAEIRSQSDPRSLDVSDQLDLAQAAPIRALISLDILPDVPPVRFDSGAMEQVVFNLLDNALKYSDKERGVKIDVSVGLRGHSDGAAGWTLAGPEILMSVRDYGMGMSREDVGRVLRPYARGAGAARRHTRGVGLGLALCQHVVKAHGGRIEIESELGRGSTFRVILPVKE